MAGKQAAISKPLEITSSRVILVEGPDEVNFFEALFRHISMQGIQIINVEGKDNFPAKFSIFLKHPDFRLVHGYALIRDADTSHAATFNSLKSLLQNHGQPCPQASGNFSITDMLKVGIFIMPGNKETGMLESLCLQTVVDHPVMHCVNNYMDCLDQKLVRKTHETEGTLAYYPKNEEKAKILAFLAGMYEVTHSLGVAALKGYWPFDHEALSELREFLKKLAE